MTKNFSVQVVYRNYIPLNSPYSSFWTHPPEGIEFRIPEAKTWLRPLYPLYRRLNKFRTVREAIRFAQSLVFTQATDMPSADAYFYVGILPEKPLPHPYYLDIEHATAFFDFIAPDNLEKQMSRILEIVLHKNCKAIVPISFAAAKSMRFYFGKHYDEISQKISVIHPALPCYLDEWGSQRHRPALSDSSNELKLLFVGWEPIKKGLLEVADAFEILQREHDQLQLTAISSPDSTLNRRLQGMKGVTVLPPKFSTFELMTKYMMTHDLFVMPTHLDSFGMVFLEALSCGSPVIATNQFAIPEMVEHGTNGMLLRHKPLFIDRDPPIIPAHPEEYRLDPDNYQTIVDGLVTNIRDLIHNRGRIKQMSDAAPNVCRRGGKFSVGYRNERLRELFLN
jgi:glycosyltransferase involved in cell wall biosynthesis